MPMRTVSTLAGAALAALVLAPSPAAARPTPAAQMADKLSDPALQKQLAAVMGAMGEAMLSIRMAPFAKVMRAAGDERAAQAIDEDTTLGDLAGPQAAQMPKQLSRQVPAMMGAMAGMAGAMEQMMPVLRQMAKGMANAAEDAAGDMREDARAAERSIPGDDPQDY